LNLDGIPAFGGWGLDDWRICVRPGRDELRDQPCADDGAWPLRTSPESASGLAYGVGFICATVLLHAIGVGLGLAIGKADQIFGRRIAQIGGGAMALAGVAILLS
jgi:hypothetical protein